MPALSLEVLNIFNSPLSECAWYAPDFSASFHDVLLSLAGPFPIIYPSLPVGTSLLKWIEVFAEVWGGTVYFGHELLFPAAVDL